jgi:hypothetical protein
MRLELAPRPGHAWATPQGDSRAAAVTHAHWTPKASNNVGLPPETRCSALAVADGVPVACPIGQ